MFPLSCSRILVYASCSPEVFILALVYIDRLVARRGLLLTSLTVHRVLITAVVVAAKFHDDRHFKNAFYASIGGLALEEFNALERDFLFSINFDLFATPEVFSAYQRHFGECSTSSAATPRSLPRLSHAACLTVVSSAQLTRPASPPNTPTRRCPVSC